MASVQNICSSSVNISCLLGPSTLSVQAQLKKAPYFVPFIEGFLQAERPRINNVSTVRNSTHGATCLVRKVTRYHGRS
jgi:hypothetical protein